MSETKRLDDGGPAFARSGFYHGESSESIDTLPTDGMTLRDYFAAKAMGAMLCADADNGRFRGTGDRTAAFAYEVADAMLRARKDGGQ